MKLKSIIWFLKRPQFIQQAFRIFLRRFYLTKESTREEATLWCVKKRLPKQKAIELLFSNHKYVSFQEAHKESYKTALKTQEGIPVKMGGPGDLDLLYNAIIYLKPTNILETGVAYGWSSMAILSAISHNKKGNLISIDMPYMHKNNEAFVGCIVPDYLKKDWTLIREADITGIKKALNVFDSEIDLCHYDSDKSYLGRMWAYPKLWKALSKNGVLISDDIQDNIAFKEFSETVNVNPIIISSQNKYVGILRKP